MSRYMGPATAPVYGKQRIKEWSSVNKRKTFFVMISSFYLSYGLVLLTDKANM